MPRLRRATLPTRGRRSPCPRRSARSVASVAHVEVEEEEEEEEEEACAEVSLVASVRH